MLFVSKVRWRVGCCVVAVMLAACGRTPEEGEPDTEVTNLDGEVPLTALATPSGCPPLATLQVVNMPTKTMGANQGGFWNLWSNGYVEQTISFPGAGHYQVTVEAAGGVVRGVAAKMELRVDQQVVGTADVQSAAWTAFNFDVNVTAGAHRVAVAFTNDAAYSRTEDRNLLLRTLVIAAASCGGTTSCNPIATLPAIAMTTKTMGADQGGFWNIWSNGYLEQQVSFPSSGTYQVDILAQGSVVRGVGANMELRIDQKVVGTVEVRATTWTAYGFSAPVSAGAHKVAVAFTNDAAYSVSEDRNLLVKTVTVAAGSCSETPPVTDPPTTTPPSSAVAEAIAQNTPGANKYYPLGVPESYSWYGTGGGWNKALSPAGFTAMTGWGVVYPQKFAATNTNPNARVELRGFKVYVHRVTGGWTLLQQQGADNIHGGYFVADFVGNRAIPWVQTNVANNTTQIGVPPNGYTAHFWPDPRASLASQSADAVFLRVDARTTDPATNAVFQLGADWWRDQNAPWLADFSNNPGIGGNNWQRLDTTWRGYYFFSMSKDQFLADLPPMD
jgi:hypothetical protein